MNRADINLVDVEASGLHLESYPIEVAVLVDGRVFSWLIKPQPGWKYWCATAEKMHGISREMLERQGEDASKVARDLSECLAGSAGPLYSDAAPWDTGWMDTLFLAANVSRRFHVASLGDILTPYQVVIFNESKKRLSESGRFRLHRAAEDVRLIHEAYLDATRPD